MLFFKVNGIAFTCFNRPFTNTHLFEAVAQVIVCFTINVRLLTVTTFLVYVGYVGFAGKISVGELVSLCGRVKSRDVTRRGR